MTELQPPKRRPTRTVKKAEETVKPVEPPVKTPVEAGPKPPEDPRIGEDVSVGTKFLTIDGKEYRAEDGVIVERVK